MTLLSHIRVAWSWIRPLIETNKISILSLIISVARQAILDQVNKAITNSEKKSAAISVISGAVSSNTEASSSLIELGFNLAFQSLKAEGKV